jgi:DNA polymerase-3 subunit epsilon
VSYGQLQANSSITKFREYGHVPRDATQIETTWLYVNKNGSPDRRFHNNKQIPVLLYSELTVKNPNLTFRLEFSKPDVAKRIVVALSGVSAALSHA